MRHPVREAPPLGFPSLIAAPTDGVHSLRRAPDPALRSVLGVSHALDGLLRQLPCGFVSPRSHVQGLPSRGLSLARSRTGFPRPVHALLALGARACGLTRASSGALDFRALSPRGECGDERNLFRVPSAPRPSWAFPPPGAHSPRRGDAFASPPPAIFAAMTPPQPILGVFRARGRFAWKQATDPHEVSGQDPHPPFVEWIRDRAPGVPPGRRARVST